MMMLLLLVKTSVAARRARVMAVAENEAFGSKRHFRLQGLRFTYRALPESFYGVQIFQHVNQRVAARFYASFAFRVSFSMTEHVKSNVNSVPGL
jgi:hypothetical protein